MALLFRFPLLSLSTSLLNPLTLLYLHWLLSMVFASVFETLFRVEALFRVERGSCGHTVHGS